MNELLILAVASMVLFLQFGIVFAFGCTFPVLLEKYGETRARTSFVHSILMGVTTGLGNTQFIAFAHLPYYRIVKFTFESHFGNLMFLFMLNNHIHQTCMLTKSGTSILIRSGWRFGCQAVRSPSD